MKYNKLVNIISIAKGRKHLLTESPSKSSKRLLVIDDLRNDKNIKYTDDKQGTNVDEKDLLIAWDGANAGTIGYGKTGFIGSTIARLRIKDPKKYYTPFFGKYLQGKFTYLRRSATGATIPHINRKALEILKFPVFDYDDQIRIATLLSRAESLIAKRKESIRLLDELIKSTFLEMFGDPVRNEKGWEKTTLKKLVINFKYGTNVKALDLQKAENEIPVLRIPNVIGGKINIIDLKYVTVSKKEKELLTLKTGDLLFVRSNGNPDFIGRCAVFDEGSIGKDYLYASYLIRARLVKPYTIYPELISTIINFDTYRNIIVKEAKTTAGNYNINTERLSKLEIIIPNKEKQQKYLLLKESIEFLKVKYESSLTELENLYGSLSQRAFRGELDLSRIPVDTAIKPKMVEAKLENHEPEAETTKRFSEKELLKILKSKSGQSFNFDELWNRLDASSFEEQPQYDDVKKMVFNMLEGEKPILSQSFDKERKEKEIVLRVNV